MTRMILMAVLFMQAFCAGAQVFSSVRLDKDTVLIGDPVTAEISITLPRDFTKGYIIFSPYRNITNQQYAADTVTQEKTADLEILDYGTWKADGGADSLEVTESMITIENGIPTVKNKIIFAVYNGGSFMIPAPVVAFGTQTSQAGDSQLLRVMLPARLMNRDTTLFNPIKDIIREKKTMADYLIYLYVLLGLLLMAGLGFYFVKVRKRKEEAEDVLPEVPVPAHIKALNALQTLDRRKLWQQGHIKDYQSALTDIIRTYIEERYGFGAMEMTTDEVASELDKRDVDTKLKVRLREILQVADLVKFARAEPGSDIHQRFMDMAADWVRQTALSKEDAMPSEAKEDSMTQTEDL